MNSRHDRWRRRTQAKVIEEPQTAPPAPEPEPEPLVRLRTRDIARLGALGVALIRSFLQLPDGVVLKAGEGSPEGRVVGKVGSIYLRTDSTSGKVLFVKESGEGVSGWVAK